MRLGSPTLLLALPTTSPTHFMHSAVMVLDRAEGPGSEAAVLKVTPVRWPLAMGVQVFPEVDHILAAARRGQEGLEGLGDPGTQVLCFLAPGSPYL